jgi:hypothetical protein
MPKPTLLDYANISAQAYNDPIMRVAGGYIRLRFEKQSNGFQGGIYARPNETGGSDFVVAYTGTQPGDNMGADVIADAGFGGNTTTTVGTVLSVFGGIPGRVVGSIINSGPSMLAAQLTNAMNMLQHAKGLAAQSSGSRIFLTGHSLGGGLAQIIAARTGFAAVPISAPAVTAVGGVEGDYNRNRPTILCVKIQNDPINQTERLGRRLGTTVVLPSGRTGGAAHSIDQTAAELKPGGPFGNRGATIPV